MNSGKFARNVKKFMKGMKSDDAGDADPTNVDLSIFKVKVKGGVATDHEPDVRNAEARHLFFFL